MCSFFFFNDTPTTEIYTLSLHDALPICSTARRRASSCSARGPEVASVAWVAVQAFRSEEHTSELQSHVNLVCRLLLEKKKKDQNGKTTHPWPTYVSRTARQRSRSVIATR